MKTDDALRHAVPIGEEPGRGSQAYGSARLPTHGLFWSLAGLFGGGGRSSIWAGGNPDTWRDLIAEYHKAVRSAADRGDFRRAALVYAKLLSDFRSAAAVLAQGGLHRESAILFRDKVHDRRVPRKNSQMRATTTKPYGFTANHTFTSKPAISFGASAKKIGQSPSITRQPIA